MRPIAPSQAMNVLSTRKIQQSVTFIGLVSSRDRWTRPIVISDFAVC